MSYEINLLPAQKKFWEIPHNNSIDVALYQGGYGSGKTFSGSLLGLTLAIKYPRILGLVTAKTVPLLRDTTLAMYLSHLEKLGLKNYKFIKSENRLVLPNKSEIIFRHAEDEEVLKSLSVGFVEIEEMSDIPEATFTMLLSRLRQERRPEWGENFKYRLFGHTNPQLGRGWIYKYFVNQKIDGYRRIIAPTTENKYLPEDYITLLKNSFSEDYYRLMVMGEDDSLINNLVTRYFDKDVQVTDAININKSMPIHITCDFNVDPMCWYIAQHYDNNVYYLFECIQNNTTTTSAATAVCTLLKEYKNHPIIINGDASGNFETTKGKDYIFIKNEFKRNGFENVEVRVQKNNPGIKYRIDCWNQMIKGPDNKHHIFIHPQCKWLIYNIENLEIDIKTGKPKLPTSKQIKKSNDKKYLGHPIDAASYLVSLYYPIRDVSYNDNVINNYKTDIFNGKYDTRII